MALATVTHSLFMISPRSLYTLVPREAYHQIIISSATNMSYLCESIPTLLYRDCKLLCRNRRMAPYNMVYVERTLQASEK